jgi:hypothetical protein
LLKIETHKLERAYHNQKTKSLCEGYLSSDQSHEPVEAKTLTLFVSSLIACLLLAYSLAEVIIISLLIDIFQPLDLSCHSQGQKQEVVWKPSGSVFRGSACADGSNLQGIRQGFVPATATFARDAFSIQKTLAEVKNVGF